MVGLDGPQGAVPSVPSVSRVRGLLLGLGLGDSLGMLGGVPPVAGPLRAGVASQLAAFTAEGVIRAYMRMAHRGICHAPSVLWHAYCRWAALQGIERTATERRWTSWPGTCSPS
ncbi:hypothetical protein [Kitasatospora paranensis]|uniref:ADP-ribosylglycohydrolase n=1 Tax=Kitasatospora paranensis TaxID=258053 RepID=A0ABW2G0A2_9ACTN